MQRPLRILAPTRYPWAFNSPRHSRHAIQRRPFLAVNKVAKDYEGITLLAAPPWAPYDLIHAFNRIPLNPGPFVIGFESHLPRAYGMERTSYYRWLTDMLAGPRCRRIVAISEHARRTFLHTHADNSNLEALQAKLEVRFPSLVLPEAPVPSEPDTAVDAPLRLTFVGNHFARKGGCVAVRVAEMARQRELPLHVTIVSTLETGAKTWTDPLRSDFFDPYIALLDQPNVTLHRGLDNAAVNALLRASDLSILATFSDTFGYSAIESLANGVPVIATRQGALPEFLVHGENALLMDIELNGLGDWKYSAYPHRDTPAFEAIYRDELERLSTETFAFVEKLCADRTTLAGMKASALQTARDNFDSYSASDYWDRLYQTALVEAKAA